MQKCHYVILVKYSQTLTDPQCYLQIWSSVTVVAFKEFLVVVIHSVFNFFESELYLNKLCILNYSVICFHRTRCFIYWDRRMKLSVNTWLVSSMHLPPLEMVSDKLVKHHYFFVAWDLYWLDAFMSKYCWRVFQSSLKRHVGFSLFTITVGGTGQSNIPMNTRTWTFPADLCILMR